MAGPVGFRYNLANDRGDRVRAWMALIQKDRNYSRILFNLPLIEPVRTEVRLAAERFGHNFPQTKPEDHATESPEPLANAQDAQ